MKKQLIVAGGALGAAALAGIAVAQVSSAIWPQLSLTDLEECRPVIAQVHTLEKNYVREVVAGECNAPARFYSAESCRSARKWLAQTEVQDDISWFFKGNDRCQGTDYPCFGVKIYNQVRAGDEAARWSRYFLEKAGRPYSVSPSMDFWTSAREADTCVSGIWASKYKAANGRPQQAQSTPVQVAETAAPPAPPLAPSATPLEPAPAAPPAAEPAALAGAAVAATVGAATLASVEPAVPTPVATAVSASTAPPVPAPAPAAVPASVAPSAAAPAATTVAAVSTSAGAAGDCANASTDAKKRVDACTVAIKGLKPTEPSYDELVTHRMTALAAAGKPAEAIAEGDRLAATKPGGEGQLVACKARVIAKQELDRALVACYSTGKPSDPAMLETRGQVHLLAGRYQDAWSDLNTAWAGGQGNALFLRGLASAGLGKTADAVKDIAKAEEVQPGITSSYEAQGYSLAAAMSGKPLVAATDAANGAVAAVHKPAPAKPAPVKPAPAAVPPAPDAPAASADPAPVAPAAAAPAPAIVPAAPVVPLPNAVYPPSSDPPPAAPPPSAAPTPATAPAVAVPVAAPGAARTTASPAAFSAATGGAVSVPGLSVPPVTECLEPVPPGNGGNGAFKNKCNYPVRFTYCNTKPAPGAEQLTCGSDTKFRAETIGGNGVAPVQFGSSIAYFACRGPSLPEVIYTSSNGLEGYCR